MISRTKTRKRLDEAFLKLRSSNNDYQYPISDFRHAIMNCVDKCRLITDCYWYFNTNEEKIICSLLFKSSYIDCEYDHKNMSVVLKEYGYACGNKVLVRIVNTTCKELPKTIYELQPKIKIVRKK